MQKRKERKKLDNLILVDEDYIFAGDLIISGNLQIQNGHSLIVSGELVINLDQSNVTINGDISADCLIIIAPRVANLSIHMDGDIYVSKNFYIANDITIYCGDIFVNGDSDTVATIYCKNLMISGNNDSSKEIVASQDIYILGNNWSRGLTCRDLFIGRHSNFNYCSLNAFRSACIVGDIDKCRSFTVGK